ncbi:TolA-binding protein [Bradyrhizobium sp. i1.3.6]
MSSRSKVFTGTVAIAALFSLCSPALAQSDDDPEMRIERLENQLRQLTGQNEELQYRNRQLEERLRALEGGAQAAPGQVPVQPSVAAVTACAVRAGLSPAATGSAELRAAADRCSRADRSGAAGARCAGRAPPR